MKWILMFLLLCSSAHADISAYTFLYERSFDKFEWDSQTIRDIYRLRVRSDNLGRPITVVHQSKDSLAYSVLLNRVLFTNTKAYNNLLKSEATMGRGGYVVYVANPAEVVKLVGRTPVSIGYVGTSVFINIGVSDADNIRVFNID